MKATVLLIVFTLVGALHGAGEPITLSEFKVQKGISETVYKNLRSTKIEPDGVRFVHDGGVVKIGFEDLPEEIRLKCGYDPAKATAYRNAQTQSAAEGAKRIEAERMAQFARENPAAGAVPDVSKLKPITPDEVKNRWLALCNYVVNPLDRDAKAKNEEKAKRINHIKGGRYNLRAQKFAHEYNAWLYEMQGNEEAAKRELEHASLADVEESKWIHHAEYSALGAMLTNPFQPK